MESSKLHLKLHSSNRLKLSWIILLYLGLETCEDENKNGESRIHVNMFILGELRLAALQRFVPCNDSWWRKKWKSVIGVTKGHIIYTSGVIKRISRHNIL